MHYYKRNIGDYHKKAGRLSLLQHGVYSILMDAIYDREKFPTRKEAIDWCWASTPEEVAAVELVLNKFFTNGNGVYRQKRIEEELNAFRSRSETNQRIAIERETKRKKKSTNRARSEHESPPNHKPLTNNHKPIKGNGRFAPPELEELTTYIAENNYHVDPDKFISHYQANGWMVGKNKMKDWKAAVRSWNARDKKSTDSAFSGAML